MIMFIMNFKKIGTCLIIFFLLCAFSTKKKKNLTIIFIGDSITYGATLKNPKIEAPPVWATTYLRHQSTVGVVSFSNQGISGYTTVDFLPATGTAFKRVLKATQKLRNNYGHSELLFSIMLGTNDSAIKGTNGAPVSPASYRTNLKSIIDELLQIYPYSKIVINYPLWYSPNTYNSSEYLLEGLNRLRKYFSQIDSLVMNYSVSDPNHVYIGDKLGFDYFQKHHLIDMTPQLGKAGIFYLHPNKRGAAILGRLWGKSIYKIIKR